MSFAATWMDLEIIILSEVSQKRQIPYNITYMWNLKYNTNDLVYETETNSQTENRLMVAEVVGGLRQGRTGILGLADANSYTENGLTVRSYCIVQ